MLLEHVHVPFTTAARVEVHITGVGGPHGPAPADRNEPDKVWLTNRAVSGAIELSDAVISHALFAAADLAHLTRVVANAI
jgi:hypothetical protein